jgi:hypothetical protein
MHPDDQPTTHKDYLYNVGDIITVKKMGKGPGQYDAQILSRMVILERGVRYRGYKIIKMIDDREDILVIKESKILYVLLPCRRKYGFNI